MSSNRELQKKLLEAFPDSDFPTIRDAATLGDYKKAAAYLSKRSGNKLRWQLLAKFPDADLDIIKKVARLGDFEQAASVLRGDVTLEELTLQILQPTSMSPRVQGDSREESLGAVQNSDETRHAMTEEELMYLPYAQEEQQPEKKKKVVEDEVMRMDVEEEPALPINKTIVNEKGVAIKRSKNGWDIKCKVDQSKPCQSLRTLIGQKTPASQLILDTIGADDISAYAAICFERMLEREQELEGEFCVFYHSYNAAAVLYEVQAEIARRVWDLPDSFAPIPRVKAKDFIGKTIPGLKAVAQSKVGDHDPGYRLCGLSVSVSLFANQSSAPPITCFHQGYGSTDVYFREILRDLIVEAGSVRKSRAESCVDELVKLAHQYHLPATPFQSQHEARIENSKDAAAVGGQMLQIFIAKSVVDQWAYHSHPLGRPFETKSSVQDWLAGERGAPAINGQARLLCDPVLFTNPQQGKIFHYAGNWEFHGGDPDMEGSRAAFVLALRRILDPILSSTTQTQLRARMCGLPP
mmetsp:Transcript_18724/g.41774  ORF Transcript_18724/g.41774 Transcript_18724/m.41774 type:complete len:522 (-) Transcript_18724:155-1720(-)